jgi:hypothetical protein
MLIYSDKQKSLLFSEALWIGQVQHIISTSKNLGLKTFHSAEKVRRRTTFPSLSFERN